MPFWPPESPLNRVELAFQQAGYDVTIGTDFTERPPMGVVWVDDIEVARAPDDDDEKLAQVAEKWLEEQGPKE
jgi:hypothetical protein